MLFKNIKIPDVLNLKLIIIQEYQNKKYFAKGYTRILSEEVFVIKKDQKTVPSSYVINGLNGE